MLRQLWLCVLLALLPNLLVYAGLPSHCPIGETFARPPREGCTPATDPNRMKRSLLEQWFTKPMFEELFPRANLGLGPHRCLPYSYESFIIAARYFPEFGVEVQNGDYIANYTNRRDVAAFFAHVVQETGENDLSLYNMSFSHDEAADCFYRGGFFQWFERGPNSSFLLPAQPGFATVDGKRCSEEGRYCRHGAELDYWYPCSNLTETHYGETYYKGGYFGRGPLQLSWNYNYGAFQHWLLTKKIKVDLLNKPNLLMTHMDPPLAMLSALWFYMTPQPPKPSMHSIIIGDWKTTEKNRRAGFSGSVFGPTSLVINNECKGEDKYEPGGPGESRRIKAFKWFAKYFGDTPVGPERSLSCKGMPDNFDLPHQRLSWQPDWATMWKSEPCDCAPAAYAGPLPFFDGRTFPERFTLENDRNRLRCVYSLYYAPEVYRLTEENSPCLKHLPRIRLTKTGFYY